jgi:sulfide:quinone oxidoreductase
LTSFPVKQGGIAAQQADAVAESVAVRAGAPVRPQPFRPVLRGLLLTGGVPAYLRSELAGGSGDASTVAAEPLWWPPAKIVGRYLAPFLAEHVGLTAASAPPADPDAVVVDVALELAADAAESGRRGARVSSGSDE